MRNLIYIIMKSLFLLALLIGLLFYVHLMNNYTLTEPVYKIADMHK